MDNMTPAKEAKAILTMLCRSGHIYLSSKNPVAIWKELDMIEARIARTIEQARAAAL